MFWPSWMDIAGEMKIIVADDSFSLVCLDHPDWQSHWDTNSDLGAIFQAAEHHVTEHH